MKIWCLVLAAMLPLRALSCGNDTASDRAIYIGDSHSVMPFGIHLQELIDHSKSLGGAPVMRYAVSGSAADHWMAQTNSDLRSLPWDYYCSIDAESTSGPVPSAFPSFPQLTMGKRPKGIVIALGTNDMNNGCHLPPEKQMTAVKELLSEVPTGARCYWIGPTRVQDGDIIKECGVEAIQAFTGRLRTTVEESGKCAYVDSREFRAPASVFSAEHLTDANTPRTVKDCQTGQTLFPNVPDHTHYWKALAEYWAACAAIEINR